MKELKDIIKAPTEEYPKMTVELQSQWFNETEGDLNKEDNIDCPICKNKGKISYVENGYEIVKNCQCMKARITYQRLKLCGISNHTLDALSFAKWNTEKEWQQKLLQSCRDYYSEIKNGNRYWVLISGQTGSGKTHLCTALFQELIKNLYLSGYYMLWNTDVPKLLALRKSSYSDNQEKYEKEIKHYKETDVLYIDDLFKLDSKYKEDSLSICYEILNFRYINNKITIISTEVTRNQFEELDEALWGRCFEKTKSAEYWFTITGKDNNYRRETK